MLALTLTDRPSTLGGIWLAIDSQFRTNANLFWVAAWTKISSNGTATNRYLQPSDEPMLMSDNVTWTDPKDDIIAMAHELTLRTVITTTANTVHTRENDEEVRANLPNLLKQGQWEIKVPNLTLVNRTMHQDAEVYMTFTETVYRVQAGWLAGAFVVIAVACLSIMPTYWGWWRLGRSVSMSPLEIAKAFDAPIMGHARPNGTADDHLNAVGRMQVRYGFHAPPAQQPRVETPSDQPNRQSFQVEADSTSDGLIAGRMADDVVESVFQDAHGTRQMSLIDRTHSVDATDLSSLRFWTESTLEALSSTSRTDTVSFENDSRKRTSITRSADHRHDFASSSDTAGTTQLSLTPTWRFTEDFKLSSAQCQYFHSFNTSCY